MDKTIYTIEVSYFHNGSRVSTETSSEAYASEADALDFIRSRDGVEMERNGWIGLSEQGEWRIRYAIRPITLRPIGLKPAKKE